jgi:hypothetical protein
MKDSITGPFFFMEATATGGVWLDMFEQFVHSQAVDLEPSIIYEQDGAPHTTLCTLEKQLWDLQG